MQKVVLATGNAGKVRELASLLEDFGLDIVAQTELGVDSAEETGLTFIENAILKARHAAQITGLPAIADDSGLATVIPFVQQLLGTEDPQAIAQLLLGQGQDVSAEVLRAMLSIVYGLFGGKLPIG